MQHGTIVVLGSVNMDVIMRVTSLATPGQTLLGQDAVLHPGGKGANQAVAAAVAGARVLSAGAIAAKG